MIIDEISLVDKVMFDWIDRRLKEFKSKPFLPFGGVNIFIMGDFVQLPCIGIPLYKQENSKNIYANSGRAAYLQFKSVIFLDKLMRQN